MEMSENKATLAKRLGCTVHISPLEMKLRRMRLKYSNSSGDTLDEWLVDICNARGYYAIFRPGVKVAEYDYPGESELMDEELAASLLLLSRVDEPRILRLASQIISRAEIYPATFSRLVEIERLQRQVKMLARQALKVSPHHSTWASIYKRFQDASDFSDSLIHWTRLAEPQMEPGKVGAKTWNLIS